jgi:hypothetical protein
MKKPKTQIIIMGVAQSDLQVVPMVVVALFSFQQVWEMIEMFWPGREK